METNDVRKYESTYALAKAIDDNEGLEHIRVKLDIIELDMDGLTAQLTTAQSRITMLEGKLYEAGDQVMTRGTEINKLTVENARLRGALSDAISEAKNQLVRLRLCDELGGPAEALWTDKRDKWQDALSPARALSPKPEPDAGTDAGDKEERK